MNPWAITIAAITVATIASGITGLAVWCAFHQRRRARRLEAAYHDEHLTVAAYQAAFGDFLNTLTSTDGEQP